MSPKTLLKSALTKQPPPVASRPLAVDDPRKTPLPWLAWTDERRARFYFKRKRRKASL